jgi:hypothetical protein
MPSHRLLDIGVAIKVDDSDVLGCARRESADGGEADGVVPAQDHGKGALRHDVGDGVGDLIWAGEEVKYQGFRCRGVRYPWALRMKGGVLSEAPAAALEI